jgi:hypothetical protein
MHFIIQKIMFSVYLVINRNKLQLQESLILNLSLHHCYNKADFNKTFFNFVSIRKKAVSILPLILYVIRNTYCHW